jgi:hypothetical protein
MASSGPVLNGSPVLNSNQAAAIAAGMALQAQQVAATDAQLGRGPAKTIVLPDRRHRPQVVRARRIVTTDDGTAPVDLVPPGAEPGTIAQETRVNTTSELRDWIKDNATLLSNASLLISISALALNLLPSAGFLNPYIQAMIFGAAFLLLIELHHQWPADLQIHVFGRSGVPRHHSWRMTAFALLFQIATVLFAIWATLSSPFILFPLAAFAVIIAFRTWYFRYHQGPVARIAGLIFLVLVLIVTELFMAVVWAVVADYHINISLFEDGLINIYYSE